MFGRVAVHIWQEDYDYLLYVRSILSKAKIKPHFLLVEEENLFGDLMNFFSKPSEERENALRKFVGELFQDYELHTLPGAADNTLEHLQDSYDLLFVKYRRQLFRRSIPEWIISGTDSLKLWVYREGARADIKKVCLPVDFSERSLRQVEFVFELKELFPFDFDLLYSINIVRLKNKLDSGDYMKSLEDKREEARHMFTDMFGEKEMNLILLEGDPYRDMVRFINSSDYDLVVVGRRGRGMRERIGSVSLHLIRSLKCPVVVL
ncbi:MAG: universal stress protein [Aquificaceae bacterium]|jgi:nucleotide-binding universal stress UspA family protein|uniref:universal stress protein n=1 Tax=Hydrogenobacter sp. Uz 6-8 TaxID=3384828 RepID=UPI000F197209|nr:MAG: hypothetical protein D6804_06735 [Aquificota bacterium]